MRRTDIENVRKKALTDAAIQAVGAQGSMDVTMADIAARAGVSPALAHHYFGSKQDLMRASVRSLLAELRSDTVIALRQTRTPRARVSAIIQVSFSSKQFSDHVVAAWLAFYVEAQRNAALSRLLGIYGRRLHSNLMSGLRPMVGEREGARIAEGAAAMIDGLYIRKSLGSAGTRAEPVQLVEDHVETQIASVRRFA